MHACLSVYLSLSARLSFCPSSFLSVLIFALSVCFVGLIIFPFAWLYVCVVDRMSIILLAVDEMLTVATTRIETMLGDTGIAVHPNDQRYQVGYHVLRNKTLLKCILHAG